MFLPFCFYVFLFVFVFVFVLFLVLLSVYEKNIVSTAILGYCVLCWLKGSLILWFMFLFLLFSVLVFI